MVEPENIAAPTPLPQGDAVAHARTFTSVVGAVVGALTGGAFAFAWHKASGGPLAMRAGLLGGIGGGAGFMLSRLTWTQNPNVFTPTLPTTAPTGQPHSQRLETARASSAASAEGKAL